MKETDLILTKGDGDRQMANDIYFGSGKNKPPAPTQANSPGAAPDARQPVSRSSAPPSASYTYGAPQARRIASERRAQSVPSRAPTGRQQSGPGREETVTEQIDSELLHRAPTQTRYNYVDTGDIFENGSRRPLSEKERQKLKKQRLKAARKNERRSGRKKKAGFRRFVRAVLCLLLVGALLLAGASAYVISGYAPQKMAGNAYVDEAALLFSPTVYNLLLMGIDTQNTADSSRSDSMILLSVDNVHMKLKLTSFMRDSYVTIPGHGDEKLNAACTYGGPQLVCDTIEYNFGVRIDGYAKIGYEVLTELVDGVGGITIPEVDAVEAAALRDEGCDVAIGTNVKMNGFQTLQYCRIRRGQDDFYRTERQREVIGQIIKKALVTNPVRLALLGRKVLAKTECSVSRAELFTLAFRGLPCLIGGTASARVPQDGTWYDDMRNGQAVLVVNMGENTAFLREFIYGK